jgi:hypothetical protein
MGWFKDLFRGPSMPRFPRRDDTRIVELDNGKFEVQVFCHDCDIPPINPNNWHIMQKTFETPEGLLVQTVSYSNLDTIEKARMFRKLLDAELKTSHIVRVVEQ